MITALLTFAAMQFVSPEASPPPVPPSDGGGSRWGIVAPSDNPALAIAYEREATALQAEMYALQQSDGGRLTAQHRAYLRKKAQALVSAYNREAQGVAPAATDTDGPKPN